MTATEWDPCADPGRVVADGDTIVMFFDGSKSSDASALVGCRVDDGHLITLGVWEKPTGPAGNLWTVDRADVDRAVRHAFATYDVVAFLADVREFESYVDTWGNEFRDRLLIEATTGRYAHPVAWDMRVKTSEFTFGCERFIADVRNSDLTHDGDGRLRRHILNARRRPNRFGLSIGKATRDSPDKIDLAVCAVGARIARQLLLAAPSWQKRTVKKRRTGRVVGFVG